MSNSSKKLNLERKCPFCNNFLTSDQEDLDEDFLWLDCLEKGCKSRFSIHHTDSKAPVPKSTVDIFFFLSPTLRPEEVYDVHVHYDNFIESGLTKIFKQVFLEDCEEREDMMEINRVINPFVEKDLEYIRSLVDKISENLIFR